MNIIDQTERFADNAIKHRRRFRRLWHWTGGSTAEGALSHLDDRLGGKGTVGYNYIIDKDGTMYLLVDPREGFMQSSGLGIHYDSQTIAISFVMKNASDDFTNQQIIAAKELIAKTDKEFHIFEDIHHAAVNKHKIDFPLWLWEKLCLLLNIKSM